MFDEQGMVTLTLLIPYRIKTWVSPRHQAQSDYLSPNKAFFNMYTSFLSSIDVKPWEILHRLFPLDVDARKHFSNQIVATPNENKLSMREWF